MPRVTSLVAGTVQAATTGSGWPETNATQSMTKYAIRNTDVDSGLNLILPTTHMGDVCEAQVYSRHYYTGGRGVVM